MKLAMIVDEERWFEESQQEFDSDAKNDFKFTTYVLNPNNKNKDKNMLETKAFQDYWKRLRNHNWWWMVADYNTDYRKGKACEERLKTFAESKGGVYLKAYTLWEDIRPKNRTEKKEMLNKLNDAEAS